MIGIVLRFLAKVVEMFVSRFSDDKVLQITRQLDHQSLICALYDKSLILAHEWRSKCKFLVC